MSYLNRLMAQTGIDLVPAAMGVEPVPSIVEMDVHQIVPPTATPVSPAAPPVSTSVSGPDRTPEPAPIERMERVTAAQNRAEPATPQASPFSQARTEPSIPEVVIEERPTRFIAELTPQSLEQTVHRQVVPEREVVVAPRATSAPKNAEVPSGPHQTPSAAKHPTFLEISNWVAATPAAGELPTEPGTLKPEPGAASQPERSTAPRDASVIRHAEVERVPVPEAPHVELSIGALQVIIEVPAKPEQAGRPQPPPPAPQAAGDLPSWSRLSRRYIHL